jgi:hypothetical protein
MGPGAPGPGGLPLGASLGMDAGTARLAMLGLTNPVAVAVMTGVTFVLDAVLGWMTVTPPVVAVVATLAEVMGAVMATLEAAIPPQGLPVAEPSVEFGPLALLVGPAVHPAVPSPNLTRRASPFPERLAPGRLPGLGSPAGGGNRLRSATQARSLAGSAPPQEEWMLSAGLASADGDATASVQDGPNAAFPGMTATPVPRDALWWQMAASSLVILVMMGTAEYLKRRRARRRYAGY